MRTSTSRESSPQVTTGQSSRHGHLSASLQRHVQAWGLLWRASTLAAGLSVCLPSRCRGLLSEITPQIKSVLLLKPGNLPKLSFPTAPNSGGWEENMCKDCGSGNKLHWHLSESWASLSVITGRQQIETTLISVSKMIHQECVISNSKLSSATLCREDAKKPQIMSH